MPPANRRSFLKWAGIAPAAAGAGNAGGPPLQSVAAAGEIPPAAADFNVRHFGARGDGNTLDTAAINRAIAAAARAGGGRVLFPAGNYLSFSIHLASRVTLYLGDGAALIAAQPPASPGASGGYDHPEPNPAAGYFEDFGHRHWHNSLIWGDGLHDVAILGPGLIWGRGLSQGYGPGPNQKQPGVADKSIALKNCHNVLLRDFSILQAGHFGILATGVDNLTIDNLLIDTNRDGMDIDCCRNVRIVNTSVNSPWDDAIVLKSSYALGYARPTEFVTIANCFVGGGYQLGTLLDGSYQLFPPGGRRPHTGRIKFGTESTGGFKNIVINNCVFERCQGLALETVDGAHLEDVAISNLSLRHVSSAPIYLRLGKRMRVPGGNPAFASAKSSGGVASNAPFGPYPIGVFRRVVISNLVCNGADPRLCSILSGIPGHPLEDVRLSDILIEHAADPVAADRRASPPERQRAYPGPGSTGPMPAHAFFIRHARGLSLSNIDVRARGDEKRPACVLQDVRDASFFHVRFRPAAPAFVLRDIERFQLEQSWPLPDTRLLRASAHSIPGAE